MSNFGLRTDISGNYAAITSGTEDVMRFGGANGDNSGQLAGFRNVLLNGAMQVSNRGVVFPDVDGYSLDRWYTNRSGGLSGLTVSHVWDAFSAKKWFMRMQRTATYTLTNQSTAYQILEIANCVGLAGSTVSLSCLIGAGENLSSTTGHYLRVSYQTTSSEIGLAGSWTELPYVPFTLTPAAVPVVKSGQFTIPSTATQLLVEISIAYSGTAGADDSVYITEIQLEKGSIITPFEYRPIGFERALCRYFFRVVQVAVSTGWTPANPGINIMSDPMRVTPVIGTVTYNGGTGAAFAAITPSCVVQTAAHSGNQALAFVPLSAEL